MSCPRSIRTTPSRSSGLRRRGSQIAVEAKKKKTDLSAALTGLVLGAVTIFLILTAIVMMTNAHYRGEKATAGAEQH